MTDRFGVVLSSASSMVGPLVTPVPDDHDAYSFAEELERLQPGIRAVPVWDEGNGWRTENGFSPERVIEMLSKGELPGDAFDDKRCANADYYMLDGVIICLEHDEEVDARYGCRYCPRDMQ